MLSLFACTNKQNGKATKPERGGREGGSKFDLFVSPFARSFPTKKQTLISLPKRKIFFPHHLHPHLPIKYRLPLPALFFVFFLSCLFSSESELGKGAAAWLRMSIVGFLTVNLSLDESWDDQQSACIKDGIREALLVPEELVGVDNLSSLDPDGIVFNNLVVPQDFAVCDLDHLGLAV